MTSQLGDFCSTAVLQPLLLGISSSKEIVNVSPKSFFGMERKKLLNLTTNRRLEVDKLKATQTFQTCLHVGASDSGNRHSSQQWCHDILSMCAIAHWCFEAMLRPS